MTRKDAVELLNEIGDEVSVPSRFLDSHGIPKLPARLVFDAICKLTVPPISHEEFDRFMDDRRRVTEEWVRMK